MYTFIPHTCDLIIKTYLSLHIYMCERICAYIFIYKYIRTFMFEGETANEALKDSNTKCQRRTNGSRDNASKTNHSCKPQHPPLASNKFFLKKKSTTFLLLFFDQGVSSEE
ncbi:hypothetical protein, unlikely [Trypanosoma brucei gambiense DAL972]|uniref:Uncharacterized protein n=1 Tax=Trypanosoma brucei gambiense (strain MHOM/CI/86/DAL972) TaxID=679716 RepID=D0A111_TRYB9|nr:hypothetical protein, unlikely [Trypanosoma brucei gambiense DAL972]CBH14953.1 hypothetical protein, unlikely [Trypanosoma brucei gambiense DAL972]|eukprot:XP_011777219.1 hypothetical protein, unlikely [Trypanosoma brucei gambiense DAL972]